MITRGYLIFLLSTLVLFTNVKIKIGVCRLLYLLVMKISRGVINKAYIFCVCRIETSIKPNSPAFLRGCLHFTPVIHYIFFTITLTIELIKPTC